MQPRLSLVTLGVSDLARSKKFYCDGLGWTPSSAGNDDVVFIQLGAIALGLFSRASLAHDANVDESGSGFRGLSLAQNYASKAEVDAAMKDAERAGAKILKPAEDVFWGGYSGYFADPDGHPWEVAFNPFFPLDGHGRVQLPK